MNGGSWAIERKTNAIDLYELYDKQVSSFFDHIRFLLYFLACGDAIKRNVPTIALYIFNVSH